MIDSPIEYLAKLNCAQQSLDGPLLESITRAVGDSSLQLVEPHRIAAVLIAVRDGFQGALRTYALPFVLATFESPSRAHHAALHIGADGSPGVSIL
jgi:hypothetical protein